MKVFLFLLSVLALLPGSGILGEVRDSTREEIVRDERPADFSSLTVNLPLEVIYTTGEPKAIIVGRKKAVEHIVIREDPNGTLTVGSDDRMLRVYSGTRIYLSSRRLESLTLNGAVEFTSRKRLKVADGFTLTANGTAEVELEGVSADSISLRCNGAADVSLLQAKCKVLEINCNGAADIDASDIDCKVVRAQINGAGGVALAGKTDEAVLTINGVGKIDAKHLDAKRIRPSVQGIGSVLTQ